MISPLYNTKSVKSQVYCSNLSNLLPSYERMKDYEKHINVLSENKSYFKSKKLNFQSISPKKNANMKKSPIKDVVFYQTQYNNKLLYTNIEKIKNKKMDFVEESKVKVYSNMRKKFIERELKIKDEKLKNENFVFGRRLENISSDLLDRNRKGTYDNGSSSTFYGLGHGSKKVFYNSINQEGIDKINKAFSVRTMSENKGSFNYKRSINEKENHKEKEN